MKDEQGSGKAYCGETHLFSNPITALMIEHSVRKKVMHRHKYDCNEGLGCV